MKPRRPIGMERNSKIWKEEVRKRYGSKCIICGSLKNIEIHHIISRINKNVFRYVPNGVPLCHDHHAVNEKSAHKNPGWFMEFIRFRRGKEWEEDLIAKSNGEY